MTLASGIAIVTVLQAEAGRINTRQARQQQRIYNGVSSGALTPGEYARLQKRQSRLAAKEAQMRASGGGLRPRERAKLEAGQDALSRAIYKQKHDAQTR
jgi:hypothetical protein